MSGLDHLPLSIACVTDETKLLYLVSSVTQATLSTEDVSTEYLFLSVW